MNRWTGEYSSDIREFAFLLRVDGEIHTYTRKWNIQGAQKAKRKRDWVEVEIGIPKSWWQENQGRNYKRYLAAEIEKGLHSMIELLRRTGREVKAEALLADWEKIKTNYLSRTSDNVTSPDPLLVKASALIKQLTGVSIGRQTQIRSVYQPLKLYKDDKYWEAWHEVDKVVLHQGRLGERGETRHLQLQPGEDSSFVIQREATKPRAEGYREIVRLSRLAIQYSIEEMGTTVDLDKRHEVEHLMNECLGWTGLGHCDGGDIGSGTMNVFCSVVEPEKAVRVVVQELRAKQVLEGARIILKSEEGDDKLLFADGSPQYLH
jgi:hypothetical protein